jgi:osmotically-inducible protein OsmY
MAASAFAGGCGFLNREVEETPQQVSVREAEEARIQREVEARLAAEPSIGPGRVRAEVRRGGEVSLHGGVTGFGALQCAIRNAELVRGVTLVIDHLVLEPGPREVQCRAPRAEPIATTGG